MGRLHRHPSPARAPCHCQGHRPVWRARSTVRLPSPLPPRSSSILSQLRRPPQRHALRVECTSSPAQHLARHARSKIAGRRSPQQANRLQSSPRLPALLFRSPKPILLHSCQSTPLLRKRGDYSFPRGLNDHLYRNTAPISRRRETRRLSTLRIIGSGHAGLLLPRNGGVRGYV
jgi:hypothetical protein